MTTKPYLKERLNKKEQFLKDKETFYKTIYPKLVKQASLQEGVFDSKGVFIGEYAYPSVSKGILSTTKYDSHSDITTWVKENWSISQIATKRFELVKGKDAETKPQTVQQANKDISLFQEIAISKKPLQTELSFSPYKKRSLHTNPLTLPFGPSVTLQHLSLIENSSIPKHVEKEIADTDNSAKDALYNLYKKGFSTEYLTQIISAGTIGKKRKIVPTKWAITAVDDSLGIILKKDILSYNSFGNVVYQAEYLGNFFLILLFDKQISFELIEFYKEAYPVSDYEDVSNRKIYAKDTAGAYYAARLSVFEWLKSKKKKAGVLIYRVVTEDYYLPLGVFVIREGVKKALQSSPITFGSPELMQSYAEILLKKKYQKDILSYKKHIKTLSIKRLSEYY